MATWDQKSTLRAVWRRCNDLFFGGNLRREPRFHVFESEVRAGYFSPGGKKDHVGVNARYFRDLPFADLIDTVAHESIHQEQSETGREVAHDDYFRKRCEEIGLDV